MKKLIMTIAIVLGLGMASFAQGGGLFERGANPEGNNGPREGGESAGLTLPQHGQPGNQDATTPLGSGIALLAALGGAYLVAKRRKE